MIRDLTDAEARAALPCKWGEVDADVLPAWVAEMDYALAPPIAEALHEAIDASLGGYPSVRHRRRARHGRTPASRAATSGTTSTPPT